MKKIENSLYVVGAFLVFYALFSRFYGEQSVAMYQFKSSSILMLANTVLIGAVIAAVRNK
ncbi:MAG: hypothetical protein PHI86_00565 [Candidatus Omnitrophica bacterium]|nr:hypothetical protein [Candidatus Omnitrophota bacterium]HOX54231.1 hypothetical protein [Candidatus Omnitrophota bacterium]